MNTKSIVSIVKCEDYTPERVRCAVDEALALAELTGLFKSGEKVLLKPNLLSPRSPDEAVTTHPAIIQAIGEIAIQAKCEVSIGDSPPFNGENAVKYAKLCEQTGVSAVAKTLKIDLVRFEESVITANSENGRFYRSFEIAQAVIDSDVIVNIPKMKTHGLTAFSGAVKNVFGCVPGIRKGIFHAQAAENRVTFAQMLVDLFGMIKPAVNVMDGVIAMEGEGPNAGKPRQVGVILASSDAVALDAVACALIGLNPMSVDTTRLAHEQGLGCGDIQQIEIRGESIESVRVSDFVLSSGGNDWARIPYPIKRMIRNQLTASPYISPNTCIGCGDCARVCPVKAITPGKPPKIDLDKCIRCYCCHEVCNPLAISLKRGWLGELLLRSHRKK